MKNPCNEIWLDIESGGYKPGEMSLIMSARNVGKSFVSCTLGQEILGLQIETVESRIHGSKILGLKLHGNVPWQEIETWCHKTYGAKADPFKLEIGRWYANNRTFWFRDERDITWFKLRWT